MSRLSKFRGKGLALGRLKNFRPVDGALFTVTLSNLTNFEAREGDAIGLTITPALSGETVSYDWTANAVSTGETTNSETVDIGGVHTDGQTLRCIVTIDGIEYTSNSAVMAYAPGAVTESALADWTIDDDTLNVNLATDFTTTNLTGSYVIAGLPSGAVDDGDGSISGTADGSPEAASFTVTFTDQYGRQIIGNYTVDTVYRAQATAADAIGAQSYTVDDDTVNLDTTSDFTTNGNTLSYVITGLPTGLADDGDGTISGTPTVDGESGTITVTATDEYGRNAVSDFTYTTAYRTQATALDGLGPFTWTVDDTSVNVDATTDFTTNGNTLTYTATGLPTGVTIAANGIISGTPTAASSASIVITGQDEYGRETTSTTSHTTSLRAQATGGADLDLSFAEDSAITATDLTANWTENGNTVTYTITGTALPTGLSVDSAGEMTGTPTDATADATYTLRGTDEYGRITSDTFTLEITAASSGVWTADSTNFTADSTLITADGSQP